MLSYTAYKRTTTVPPTPTGLRETHSWIDLQYSPTDVRYVDNTNSQFTSNFTSHTKGGFSIFPGDDEGPVYCEGFAWSRASLEEASYRYRENVLYKVALQQNLVNRGYVRGVPGALMCGCVGKMSVILRTRRARKWLLRRS